MMPWSERSREERTLLNPGFCAHLLWHAARGYADVGNGALSFEEAFLVLPIVLHRKTREALPRDTRTSLPVWLETNPLARGQIASRARILVAFTKEAIVFGGTHGLISLEKGQFHAEQGWKRSVNRSLKESSDEVRVCAKRADFVGKWFAITGGATTVLTLVGVRP